MENLTNEDLEKIAIRTKNKAGMQRFSRKQKKVDLSRSHNKKKDNRNKSKKNNNRYKECPYCGATLTRRTKEGTCPKCERKIYLANNEYFKVEQPIERLIIHNWSQYTSHFLGIDVSELEDVSHLMPSPDDVSPIYLKNEAWAAQKLLDLCNKDFDLAYHTILVYHENTGRTDTRELSLHYIVSSPGLKILVQKARRHLYESKIEKMTIEKSARSIQDKQKTFGSPFENQDLELKGNDEES